MVLLAMPQVYAMYLAAARVAKHGLHSLSALAAGTNGGTRLHGGYRGRNPVLGCTKPHSRTRYRNVPPWVVLAVL
jgi:hypothetical protein